MGIYVHPPPARNRRHRAAGEILAKVAQLVDEGCLKTTATHIIDGINAANLRHAHQLVERGDMVGKVVLAGW